VQLRLAGRVARRSRYTGLVNAHDFLSSQPSDRGERFAIGYPDECRDFTLFADSLAALLTDGEWLIQPFTQKMQAIVVDFVSEREAEAEASLPHGWNGATEFPMGVVNTVHSRVETNEQNARIGRHLCLLATGFTLRDFHWQVVEKLLDTHSCREPGCKVCELRFSRDLSLTFTLLADGLGLDTVTLFSKWEPSAKLREALAAENIQLVWRPLSDIPAADLEANRYYSIWDGTEMQCRDFLQTFWSPGWMRRRTSGARIADDEN
jgi:hypothetical protein